MEVRVSYPERRAVLDTSAQRLLEKETLVEDDLRQLVGALPAPAPATQGDGVP